MLIESLSLFQSGFLENSETLPNSKKFSTYRKYQQDRTIKSALEKCMQFQVVYTQKHPSRGAHCQGNHSHKHPSTSSIDCQQIKTEILPKTHFQVVLVHDTSAFQAQPFAMMGAESVFFR